MSILAHNLSTDDAVIDDAAIAAAHERLHRAAEALSAIPARDLPDGARDNLLWLAYHGVEVSAHQVAGGVWMLDIPAARDANILLPNGLPAAWLGASISLSDWRTHSERITAVLLAAQTAKEVR